MSTFNSAFTKQASVSNNATFMSGVWTFFGIGIAVAALGAWAGEIIISSVDIWIPYILFMGLMFTQGFWAEHKSLALPLYFVFTFTSGTILYPTLIFAAQSGQIGAVIQALAASSGLFFAAAIFGYTTKKDLSGWGQFLFFTMIGLLIAGIVNIFLNNSMLHFIFSAISVVLFSAYTAYDVQAIKRGLYGTSVVMAALHLYINMFALFNNLLTLFLSNND